MTILHAQFTATAVLAWQLTDEPAKPGVGPFKTGEIVGALAVDGKRLAAARLLSWLGRDALPDPLTAGCGGPGDERTSSAQRKTAALARESSGAPATYNWHHRWEEDHA